MRQTEAERVATVRNARVEKYFNKTPSRWQIVGVTLWLLLAIAFAIAGQSALQDDPKPTTSSSSDQTDKIVGSVLVVLAVFCAYRGLASLIRYVIAYRKGTPKPSPDELDRLLAADLNTIRDYALYSLDLTPEELETGEGESDPLEDLANGHFGVRREKRPIVVFGPQPQSGFAVGSDKVWRFRAYEVMVICPTRHHLGIFRADLNFLTGGLFNEETQEYQYAHVVSVSTNTYPMPNLVLDDRREKEGKGKIRFARTALKKFEVGVSSGRSSSVTVGISDDTDDSKQARLPDSGIQSVISSVRRVLREKHTAQ